MDIKKFITDWVNASNSFQTEKYLEFFQQDAVLDDPSVGRSFNGHKGIKDYYTSYFIDYNTYTEIVKLDVGTDEAFLEVKFTGNFPEGHIGGTFSFRFKEGKITNLKADLL